MRRGKPGFLFYLYFIFVWRRRCPDKKRRVNARHGAREEKLSPLTPAWAFDRGFCLGNFIYPLTPAGCPPLPGRRCCSAAFSPGESKKRRSIKKAERRRLSYEDRKAFPGKGGAALKRRNAAAYSARAEKLSHSRRRGRSTVVFAWAILFTHPCRRAVRCSPVAGAAPPHFYPAR